MERFSLKAWFRQHYHWVVLAVAFIEFTIAIGIANNLYSLYLIPVTEGLSISRGTFSISSSMRYLAAFISNLLFGILYRRHGYRRMAALALVLTAMAYVGYSTAQNMIPFCLGAFVVGIMESFCSTAGTSRLITDWFHRHQGLILGIVMASSGFGGSLFSIIMSAVMEKSSFRTALMLSAGLIFAAGILVFLFVRDHPSRMGLKPLGDEEDRKAEREKYARNVKEWQGIPMAVLKKRPSLYLMLISTFLVSFGTYGIYAIVASHARDVGLDASQAALIQSTMFLTLALAKIIEGGLSDRFGANGVMILCLILNVVSMILLAVADSFWMLVIAVTVFSLPLAVPSIMLPMLTADMFGRHDYGTILGLMLAMVSLSGVAAAPSINYSFDLLGSYVPALFAMAALGVLTMALYMLAVRFAVRDRKKAEQELADKT